MKRKAWVHNPVDAFVLAQLEARGLSPAPPASRPELIRRLTFDLTGLPPSPEEVAAFVADRAPGAYERVVDRLLASPRYGERWARRWLDIARFAESQGFERDKLRDHAWRYRDYVIDAFNSDMPYNRFVQEQIAGDVLPNATRSSIVATGFLVAGPYDEVGQQQASAVMRARVREDELEDIVSVTAQTFLGLTVNCARCHDHKFDPISAKDYYRFQASLAGVRAGDRSILPPAEAQARQAETDLARRRVAELEREADALEREVRRRLAGGRTASAGAPLPVGRWSFEGDTRDSAGGLDAALAGGAVVAEGRLRLNGAGAYARTEPLLASVAAKTLEAWVVLPTLEQGGGGVLTVEDLAGRLFDGIVYGERQPRKWIAGSEGYVRTRDLSGPPEDVTGAPIHVAVTYAADGRITLYRNGQPYEEGYVPGDNGLRTYPAGGARLIFGLRHSEGVTPADRRWLKGDIEEARLYDRALSPAEVLASFRGGPLQVGEAEIQAALTPEQAARRAQIRTQLAEARAALLKASEVEQAYAVKPLPPGPVFLLNRGDLSQQVERVSPGALSSVPGLSGDFGLPPDAPDADRRLKLAEWITHPANPLTPRVLVNRVWQGHFGQGLVRTPSDFGINGEPPTHPELLDWLAARFAGVSGSKFQVSGSGNLKPETSNLKPWSIKDLHRLIVTSNAYRQGPRFDPKAAAVDAENRLLWRMAPRRLEAEEIRDAILAVSGQLNLQAGGPGFRPFSLVVSNSHFYTYEDRIGPEYNRRGIYRTVVNSGGIPLLEAFDCPDPSVKTPRRSSTTTPLQAMALLNNSFVLRQAREMAKRVEQEAGAGRVLQVDRAYRLAFGRAPTFAEAQRALPFVEEHGLAAFCRVLLNASEFVYVR